MAEKTQYIVQLQLIGNNVDKVISIGVSPDEFVNLDRAENKQHKYHNLNLKLSNRATCHKNLENLHK
jgi:hypothetical protein